MEKIADPNPTIFSYFPFCPPLMISNGLALNIPIPLWNDRARMLPLY